MTSKGWSTDRSCLKLTSVLLCRGLWEPSCTVYILVNSQVFIYTGSQMEQWPWSVILNSYCPGGQGCSDTQYTVPGPFCTVEKMEFKVCSLFRTSVRTPTPSFCTHKKHTEMQVSLCESDILMAQLGYEYPWSKRSAEQEICCNFSLIVPNLHVARTWFRIFVTFPRVVSIWHLPCASSIWTFAADPRHTSVPTTELF